MSAPRRMSQGSRLALAIALAIALLFLSTAGAIAAVVYSSGSVGVAVESEDTNLSLRVPSLLISGALYFVPDDVYAELAREVGPYWPIVREFCRELEECPDAVFVDVRDRGEHVTVSKRGDRLLVNVEVDDCDVAVAIPLRAVTTVAERVGNHLD